MSRYPHRIFAEKHKRVQTQNCIEDKFLKQKLDSFSREKLYIDRELRRISLARSSLLESLDRFNTIPRSTHKRLSLPCLLDGPRKEQNARPMSPLRRHTVSCTVPPLEGSSAVPECKQPRNRLSFADVSIKSRKESTTAQRAGGEGTHCVQRLHQQQQVHEMRVASPITVSLVKPVQVQKNKSTTERSLISRQTSTDKAKTGNSLSLPNLPNIPAQRELNPLRKDPAGHENPRDEMLAANLKSKFRQIGSVFMATAILRIANEKKAKTQNN